jgi:23S rRNA (adenine2503-C2)-methyltransferase
MAFVLKNGTAEDLYAALAPLGASPRLARRIQAAALRRDEFPEHLPEVSPTLLGRIRQAVELPRLRMLDKQVSPVDGFAKYLFRGAGPEPFEAVRIPLLHRPGKEKYVACISSQVGCAMGCAFCATGRMGFVRNLATWEMVDQAVRIAMDSPHPVCGVVFMGMGEPMLNYDAVVGAANVLNEPCGMAIAAKGISLSTVGIVPGILRFAEERLPFRLVVSLGAATSEKRRRLLPVESVHPLPDLVAALRRCHAVGGQRLTLAWTMISGFNVGEQDAIDLARLVGDLPVTLDLIDVNDPCGLFRPPSTEELDAFRDHLRKHLSMPVARRYSGGKDVHAACGMLAGGKRAAASPIP